MRKFLKCLSIPVVVLLLAGCGMRVEGKATDSKAEDAAKKAVEEVLIPIHADRPSRGTISAYFETTARVIAENRVDVVTKGIGQAQAVLVEVGDVVKAGQVLAELDKKELAAQLSQTKVSVQQQRTAFEIAERSLSEGIGSKIERDNAKFALDQALATLEVQQVQLSHQTITAPIDGVVTARNVQQGMMVSSGMPAFSIVDPTSFVLPISVPEKELVRLSMDQAAQVTIDSRPGEVFEAAVRRIDPSVDPVSGTVKVLLRFNDAAREYLREAAFARVRLVMETRENVLVVPKDTLLEENARKYLMVVREETPEGVTDGKKRLIAERLEVKTGLEDSNNVEIVSGLEETTLIVTLGQHTLKAGAAVSITNARDEILSRAGISAEEALAAAKHKEQNLDDGRRDRRERMVRR